MPLLYRSGNLRPLYAPTVSPRAPRAPVTGSVTPSTCVDGVKVATANGRDALR